MVIRSALGVATAGVLAAGLLLTAPTAWAQTADDFIPDCDTGVLSYPAGLAGGTAVSNTAPLVGESVTASSGVGTYDAGSPVGVELHPGPTDLGSVSAGEDGNAVITFAVPDTLDPGLYVIRFEGVRESVQTVIGVCVNVQPPVVLGNVVTQQPPAAVAPAAPQAAPQAAPRVQPRSLPFTGSVELVTVAGIAAALVGVGAVTLVATRRRHRHGDPAQPAA